LRRRKLGTFVGPGATISSPSKVRSVYVLVPEDDSIDGPCLSKGLCRQSGATNVNLGFIPEVDGVAYVKELLQSDLDNGQLIGVIATGAVPRFTSIWPKAEFPQSF